MGSRSANSLSSCRSLAAVRAAGLDLRGSCELGQHEHHELLQQMLPCTGVQQMAAAAEAALCAALAPASLPMA
jgi:hypothetical protein